MKLKIKVPKRASRAHIVLFVNDTPFKPKKEASKKEFKRHPKHKNKD